MTDVDLFADEGPVCSEDAVGLFAGIGVGLALRELGITEHGIDIEPHVAATRERLGLTTTLADITTLDPRGWAGVDGVWASPPCPDFSQAGKGAGIDGPSGRLIFEPVRWVEAIRPRWVAMEQVPPAAPLFREMARRLEAMGYRATVARMSSEEWGVPQTRERVYLMAHRDRSPRLPSPTHQNYVPGVPPERPANLMGLLPWVSMAEALGLPDGLIVDTGTNTMKHSRVSAEMVRYTRSCDAPAPTTDTKAGGAWTLKSERRGDAERRSRTIDEPAPTLIGHIGHTQTPKDRRWMWHRPSTPVACAGLHGQQMNDAIKLTTAQGCRLMGFPHPDDVAAALPATKRAAWQVIGNACCPPVVAAIVQSLTKEAP